MLKKPCHMVGVHKAMLQFFCPFVSHPFARWLPVFLHLTTISASAGNMSLCCTVPEAMD